MSALEEVAQERARQDALWGEQNHPDGTGTPHLAHWPVRYREGCEAAFRKGSGTWRHIFLEEVGEAVGESDPEALRGELVQVAAVAVAWVEAIDRRATS